MVPRKKISRFKLISLILIILALCIIGLTILLVSLSGTLAVLGKKSKAGGLFGAKIAEILSGMVSKYGALVVFFFVAAIAFIVIFDVSLEQLFGFLGKYSPMVLMKKLRRGGEDGEDEEA